MEDASRLCGLLSSERMEKVVWLVVAVAALTGPSRGQGLGEGASEGASDRAGDGRPAPIPTLFGEDGDVDLEDYGKIITNH